MNIKSLYEATDNDIVAVFNMFGILLTTGNWFQDNILKFSNLEGKPYPGYRFEILRRKA